MTRKEDARVLHARAALPHRLHEVTDLTRRRGERAGEGTAHRTELRQDPPRSGDRAHECRPDEPADRSLPGLVGRDDGGKLSPAKVLAGVVRKRVAAPDDQEKKEHGAGREAPEIAERDCRQRDQSDTKDGRAGAAQR